MSTSLSQKSEHPALQATTLGDRIKEAYKNAGYSQSSFARALRTGVMVVYRWEKGQAKPSLESLTKISTLTGYAVSEIQGKSKKISPELKEFLETDFGKTLSENEVVWLMNTFLPAPGNSDAYTHLVFAHRALKK